MSELDVFEARFVAAYRRYLDEAPSEVDAAAVVRTVTAAHPRAHAGTWPWALRTAPALAWLVLLALLLAALGAAAFFVGSQPVRRLPAVVPPVGPTATPLTTYTAVSAGTYVAVSVGGGHTCAIGTDGTLECWGSSYYGEATPPEGTYVAVSAGWEHACAIRTDGNLECWGRNLDGEATPPEGTYVAVSAAVEHTCAIRTDGTLECWGSNAGVAGATPGTYSAVSDTCAIRTDGTLTCWGPDPDPWPPPPAGTYVAVSSAGEHACAIRSDGKLTCWGQDYWGQATPPEGKYVAVSAGWWHACAIRTDGMLTCWAPEPGPPPPAGSYIAVSASMPDYEACAIRTDGKLACWGSDWIARTKNMGGSWIGPPTALIPAMGRIYPAREAPERRRGTIEFGSGGSGRIITTPSATFSVGDTIRFAASLEREVRAGEAVTIALSVDGGAQGEVEGRRDVVFETSRSFDMPGDCIGGLLYWLYAAPPWSDLSAFPVSWTTGHYRLELSAGGKVLAEGEFDVGP
jgi:hypothetical protein